MIQIQVVSIPQFTQKMKRHFSRESTSLNITAERMEPRGIIGEQKRRPENA
jgi:hypothetical protein